MTVQVTVIQLVLNSFIAVHSDRLPSEIFITVSQTLYIAIAQNKIRHYENFPYLFWQGTKLLRLPGCIEFSPDDGLDMPK